MAQSVCYKLNLLNLHCAVRVYKYVGGGRNDGAFLSFHDLRVSNGIREVALSVTTAAASN